MTQAKLLLEISDIISSYEHESPGEQVSCSLQIITAKPGSAGGDFGPIFAWDGRTLQELPEGAEVRI
jgi:hypothetical protein